MDNIVLSVAAPKGGVGKTTTAVNLAVGLALKKKKTLIFDMDPSGYCSSAFGFSEDNIFANITDLYKEHLLIKEIIHSTEIPYLEIVPAKKKSYNDENLMNSLLTKKYLLKEAISNIKDQYDYIILDCPPTLTGATFNSIISSNHLIIPVQSSKFSLEALDSMFTFLKEFSSKEDINVNLDGIVLTMYESRTRAAFEIKKEIFNKYPNYTFRTTIPKNIKVAEATFSNKPVLIYDKNCPASKAYFQLVDEIIEKHETSLLMSLSGFSNSDMFDDELK